MANESSAGAHSALRSPTMTRLLRRVYTSNPFYVLSADLVFVGLRMSLDTSGKTFQTSALMLSLLGYTLLLATTACLLIRLGKVWDDVRTILLLVVAMFLAVSVTFDETLAWNPRLGKVLYLGGLIFAIVVSECLLRGIRLRLPALFKLPYYVILSLFFLYPVALTPLLGDPENRTLQWALFAFSPLAGFAFLSLIPAIRRGPSYVASNGSPWRYPLYPWVLVGLLGAAVCGRAYYVCVSFHFVERSDSIFGFYFLVPFLFVAVLLLLEIGVVSKNSTTQRTALFALPALLFLSAFGHRPDSVYQSFLTTFTNGLGGSPLFLAMLAVTATYGFAACRRLPLAVPGLTCSLLAFSVIGPQTLDLGSLVEPKPLPLLLVATLQLAIALRRGESWRMLLGSGALVVGFTILVGRIGWAPYQGAVGFHLALLAFMLIGTMDESPLAHFLQKTSALLLGLACLTTFWLDPMIWGIESPRVVRAYPFVIGVIAVAFGYATRCRPYLIAGSVGLLGWLTLIGWRGYSGVRGFLVGLDWIVGGMAFFGLATLISLSKAGVLSNWITWGKDKKSSRPLPGTD